VCVVLVVTVGGEVTVGEVTLETSVGEEREGMRVTEEPRAFLAATLCAARARSPAVNSQNIFSTFSHRSRSYRVFCSCFFVLSSCHIF